MEGPMKTSVTPPPYRVEAHRRRACFRPSTYHGHPGCFRKVAPRLKPRSSSQGESGMSGYVLRRSLLSLLTLGAILVVAGGVVVALGVPVCIPVLAYYAMLAARSSRGKDSVPVLIGAYAVYVVSTLIVLALARARETAADHHSCDVTGDGDALCSALVKIAYGMGQVKAAQEAEARDLLAATKGGRSNRQVRRESALARQYQHRIQSMRVMAIADPNQAAAVTLALAECVATEAVLGA